MMQDKGEIQEGTASPAVAKNISMEAAVGMALSNRGGIFTLKEEQRRTKAFLSWKKMFLLSS